MKNRFLGTIFAGIVLLMVGSVSAYAGTYTFDFNSTGATPNLAKGSTNTAVQTYMRSVLGNNSSCTTSGKACVTVSGSQEANGYTGDQHVTGSGGVSKTLGTDDGSGDGFLINTQQYGDDTIKMSFTGLQLYSVTFDLEIFPDATCTSTTNCSAGLPDFKFYAGTGSTPTLQQTWYGAFPANGTYSPAMPSGETAAQKIVLSWTYTSSTPFTTIWFQDWPATIGVDNLSISTTPPVPEPASMLLMGSGMLAVIRRKMKKS